jgi:hypothetical protein
MISRLALNVLVLMMITGGGALSGCTRDEAVRRPSPDNSLTDGDVDSDADGDADENIPRRQCEDGESVSSDCYCVRMGVVGIFDSAANEGDNDVSAFVDWLNHDSSAKVTMINQDNTAKPTINAKFLDDYDVLLFLYQSSNLDSNWWTYSKAESDALRNWIEAGGGVISVTGFNGRATQNEVSAINSILTPATGLSYSEDPQHILNQCPSNMPCFCWWNAVPLDGFNPEHPISYKVTQIGAMIGSKILAPDDAEIVASNSEGNTVVAREIGRGRAVAIADEWPLFSRLWVESLNTDHLNFQIPEDEDTWPSHPCYNEEEEYWMTPGNVFQIPQFWYNSIKWASGDEECFVIEHPTIYVE